VKLSKAHFYSRVHRIPELKFEDQRLTSYSGLVVLQAFFKRINLKNHLKKCFKHLSKKSIVGFHIVTLILIVNIMLGFRKLRDIERFSDDPMVLRTLQLRRLPDVSTISRIMSKTDKECILNVRNYSKLMTLERIEKIRLNRCTIDFDGSVTSTTRYAEGTAVGFNKQKKGRRSYYPLFSTIAQTGMVLDVHHRPGNVHDSNGADTFIQSCIKSVKAINPRMILETRHDSAFFSDKIVKILDSEGAEFTISVPFERFAELKGIIESRKRWKKMNKKWSYFESDWSPKCWDKNFRFIFIRQKVKKQNKKPIQLDLFRPYEYGYDFKVIITNKKCSAKKVLRFHNGRGAQENIFSELKSQCQMDYIPVRKLTGNQLYIMSAVFSHNLFREMQMEGVKPNRNTTEKRTPLWIFKEAKTIQLFLFHRAGRITRPGGKLRLTLSGNEATKKTFLEFLHRLMPAA
jgi:hypothetical protein